MKNKKNQNLNEEEKQVKNKKVIKFKGIPHINKNTDTKLNNG